MADHSGDGVPQPGFLKRALSRLATSTPEMEAAELREDAAAAGCEPIARCGDREVVTVHGTLRTVTLRPRGGVAALEAELYDGSGSLSVIWLGRRQIAGIEPGRRVIVHGMVTQNEGRRAVFNPRYELEPRGGNA